MRPAGPLKALVIGGSGMLGKALTSALRQAGIDASPTYNSRPFPGGVALNITDADAVRSCFEDISPDLLFIAVMPSGGADYCETHTDELNALNVEATRSIAESAASAGTRVVYYSSDYVFDGTSGP
ncbi:MAG: sugar nucleotide-binding protein, partial [Chloroflexi bacterium]|nr:sugar nucleotide-binding protein [Chloroflexota bacterium]